MTAATFINLLNLDTDFDDETMEKFIDTAIDLLNLEGEIDLPNMAGVAGTKTVTLTSPQRGAVIMVTQAVYKALYEDDEGTVSTGAVTISAPSVFGNSQVMKNVKIASRKLYRRENPMEVDIG